MKVSKNNNYSKFQILKKNIVKNIMLEFKLLYFRLS